jgi:hypothetical protein
MCNNTTRANKMSITVFATILPELMPSDASYKGQNAAVMEYQ